MAMSELWSLVEWHREELSPPHELKKLLLRPLPFRLTLDGSEDGDQIFQPNAPRIDCPRLAMIMGFHTHLCEKVIVRGTTGRSWLPFYGGLLQISIDLCYANGLGLEQARLDDAAQGLTSPIKLPDCFITHNGVVLLRGEEMGPSESTRETLAQVTATMGRWNARLYGDLPYVVSYATSGSTLEVAVVEPSDLPLRYTSIVTVDIVAQKEVALKVYFNLAMLLRKMADVTQRPDGWTLDPLMQHQSESRTLVLTDTVVARVITRAQCRDYEHFERLGDVYTTLQLLNTPAKIQAPYLQTVERLTIDSKKLVVHLSPVGCPTQPADYYEVKQWLQHVLTALKHWHERGYCHGDIRWSNIVFVPSGASGKSGRGHWVLIDMGKSCKHDTEIITWTHQHKGERLRFQHDLIQLGKLMDTFPFTLSETLTKMKEILMEAVDKAEITAAATLKLLEKVED